VARPPFRRSRFYQRRPLCHRDGVPPGSGRPGAMGHSLRPRDAAPADQRAFADGLNAANLSPNHILLGMGVRVKVERIRGGRRLPDVEYIETRAPRRPQTGKQELVSFRAPFRPNGWSGRRAPPAREDQPPPGLARDRADRLGIPREAHEAARHEQAPVELPSDARIEFESVSLEHSRQPWARLVRNRTFR
jgi:hypothetical protein